MTDVYGHGKGVLTIGDRVTVRVLMFGIMHKLFHIYFHHWNVR